MSSGKLGQEWFKDLLEEKPQSSWRHFKVWERIRESLYVLPSTFKLDASLPTIPAADLHSANTLLGSAIEEHIPVALNALRTIWDPSSEYADCLFKRQPQTFPDVLFRRESEQRTETVFGIEVKSWYILAKEMEPSFRFYVNKEWCASADLCVVYPWALSSGVSGTPRLFRPLVISARKAARLRNESWIKKAQNAKWREIVSPKGTPTNYPTKGDQINDSSPIDSGGNLGRIARSGVWDVEIERLLIDEHISGIPLKAWHRFLSAFKQGASLDDILGSISKVALPESNNQEILDGLQKVLEGASTVCEQIRANYSAGVRFSRKKSKSR